MSALIEERFVDPVDGSECTLRVQTNDPTWWDGKSGVVHAGCDVVADVSPDLDAFYCRTCGRNGRISGAWAMDILRGAKQRQEA